MPSEINENSGDAGVFLQFCLVCSPSEINENSGDAGVFCNFALFARLIDAFRN